MTVVLIHNVRLPVHGYGGTERLIGWLAKAYSELGVKVKLALAPGSACPYGSLAAVDFLRPIDKQVEADLFHYFSTPDFTPEKPYLVTIGGNGKEGERFSQNSVFVSQNHATRHGAEAFVYPGIDPGDYLYSEKKQDYFIFLGKASWRVKNVRGAIRIAKRAGLSLRILGGKPPFFLNWNSKVQWEGMAGGEKKRNRIAFSAALIFPVLWDEPFGIAVAESLVSGTPVVATPFGSLTELLPEGVGFVCKSETEFVERLSQIGNISSQRCRDWAMNQFHYHHSAKKYLRYYETILSGAVLNPRPPCAEKSAELYSLPTY